MAFSCYSNNENMGQCQKQCDYCRLHYHGLRLRLQRYKINVRHTLHQKEITVHISERLMKDLKALKRKDQTAFINALVELISNGI